MGTAKVDAIFLLSYGLPQQSLKLVVSWLLGVAEQAG